MVACCNPCHQLQHNPTSYVLGCYHHSMRPHCYMDLLGQTHLACKAVVRKAVKVRIHLAAAAAVVHLAEVVVQVHRVAVAVKAPLCYAAHLVAVGRQL